MRPIRSSLARSARRLRSAAGGAAVVLTYHRIVDVLLDPQRMAVAPERFAEHVAAFSARYELMSAGTMLHALVEGRRLPRRGLVITLDDGYADALTHAHPTLKANDAPATVFVSTGGLTATREFWWDELEQLFLFGALPRTLAVPDPAGGTRSIELTPEDSAAPAPESLDALCGWDVFKPADSVRKRLYADTTRILLSSPPAQRERLLDELWRQTGLEPERREHKRSLSPEQVAELARDGLVEIGAHTVDHAWLASLPVEQQREQIGRAKGTLAAITGGDIASFSYPYGTSDSFTTETRRLAREAGFLGAFTTELGGPLPWGSVSLDSDRFALPRMAANDVPAGDLISAIDQRLGL